MWNNIFNWFAKITGWPLQKVFFRTAIHYEDRSIQGRRIKGPAIIISNHTSIWDYAVWLFVFPGRTLRFQMAEVLFKKPGLGLILKWLGGIYVDRNTHDFTFIARSEKILKNGGVVGIFPESRLPLPTEKRPLPFKPSAAYLALSSGVKVIPVYTDGSYFNKVHANVVVGCPFDVREFTDDNATEKENLEKISAIMRDKIIELGQMLDESK